MEVLNRLQLAIDADGYILTQLKFHAVSKFWQHVANDKLNMQSINLSASVVGSVPTHCIS